MADAVAVSVNKAATARQHRRPPPLERKGTPKFGALQILSSFMDMSVTILHDQLNAVTVTKGADGAEVETPDLGARRAAARYVLDKITGAEGTYIPEGLDIVIDSDRVIDTGNQVLELVMNGHMSIEAGQKVFGLLHQQAALHGLTELDELREMVARLSGAAAKTVNGVPGSAQNPTWMKLAAGAPSGRA